MQQRVHLEFLSLIMDSIRVIQFYYTPEIVNDAYVDPGSGTSIDNFVIKSSLMDEGSLFYKKSK